MYRLHALSRGTWGHAPQENLWSTEINFLSENDTLFDDISHFCDGLLRHLLDHDLS